MTAKTPAKVHLRLRFQNLGKPRTAGLCGRAADACDCGSLSCTKIERPSPLEKPSCKVQLFAQNRSRNYRQKVTATTPSQTAFHRVFQLLAQTAHVRFRGRKWVHTLGFRRRIAHKGSHAETRGISDGGWYHYPRSVPHVHEHPRAGCQNGVFCRFWALTGCAHKEHREPSGQRCAYARRCPEGVAAPPGCVIFSVSVEIAACMPCAQGLSMCARRGVVSLPSARFTCCRNAGRPLVKTAHLPFSEVRWA